MFYVDPVTGDERQVPYDWSKKKKEEFADEFGLHIISKSPKGSLDSHRGQSSIIR